MQAAQSTNLNAYRLAMRQQVFLIPGSCPQCKTRPGAQHFKQLQALLLSGVGVAMNTFALGNTEFMCFAALTLLCQDCFFKSAETLIDFVVGFAEGILVHDFRIPSACS